MSRQLNLVNGLKTTFTKIITGSGGLGVLAVDSVNPLNLYFSNDAGTTFTVLYTFSTTTGIRNIAANGDLSYILISTTTGVATNDGSLFVSSDSGSTFSRVAGYSNAVSAVHTGATYHALSVTYDGSIMAASAEKGSQYFFCSIDYGATWKFQQVTKKYFSVAASINNIYCGCGAPNSEINYYTNGAYSGSSIQSPQSTSIGSGLTFNSIQCTQDGKNVFASALDSSGTTSTIYRSTNTGSSFVTLYSGLGQGVPNMANLVITKMLSNNLDGSSLLAMDSTGKIAFSDNANETTPTFKALTPPSGSILDIAIDYQGSSPYIAYTAGLYTLPPPRPAFTVLVKSGGVVATSNGILCNSDASIIYLFARDSNALYKSTDFGNTYPDTITLTYPSGTNTLQSVIGNLSLSYLLIQYQVDEFYKIGVYQPGVSTSVSESTIRDSSNNIFTNTQYNNYNLQAISSSGQYMYIIANLGGGGFTISFRSIDYGTTFNQLSVPSNAITCSSDGSKVFVLSGNDIKISTDYGATFPTTRDTGIDLTSGGASYTLLCDSTGQTLFICFTNGDFGSVNKSTDQGQNWTQIYSSSSSQRLLCDSTGTYLMLFLLGSGVYFSDDAGSTWKFNNTLGATYGEFPGLATTTSGLKQFILYTSGLYLRSGTSEVTPSLISRFMTSIICSADASTVLCLSPTDITTIYRSTNYGGTFTPISGIPISGPAAPQPKIIYMAANSDCSKILYATSINGSNTNRGKLYLYTSGTPVSQTLVDASSNPITTPYNIQCVAMSGNGNNMYAITSNNRLYRRTTGANFVLQEYNGSGFNLTNSRFVRSSHDGTYIFIRSTSGSVYISSDSGATYKPIVAPGFFNNNVNGSPIINNMTCDSSGSILYYTVTGNDNGTGRNGIYKIVRSGTTWQDNPSPTQLYLVNENVTIFTDIVCNSSGTYMAAMDDILFSDDGGVTWKIVPNPLPSRIGPVAINSSGSRIYYTFSGIGLFTRNASAIATPCFLEGTKILCNVNTRPTYLPIETLTPGTLVKTAFGHKKIKNIGKSAILNPGHSGRTMDRLYVCKKENFPELTEDLYITGYHSILVDELTEDQQKRTVEINGQVFEADSKKCLMASVCEKTEPWAQEGTFTIWHLCLEDEDQETKFGVYSNGLLTETCSVDFMDKCIEFTK